MKGFDQERPREGYERMAIVNPAVESFSDPERAREFWPDRIAGEKEFHEQLKERKDLNERLDAVIACLPRPDVSIDDALTQGLLTEQQVADLYASLALLLEDNNYERLALYLPFEFLPGADTDLVSSQLQNESGHFKRAYMSAWRNLLSVRDVRANFVDGNILDFESRTGDLPRVVKAAHLIPKLVEKGFLSVDDAITLFEINENETLKRNIAETFPVLADMKLISKGDIERLESIKDPLITEKLAVINASEETAHDIEMFSADGITLSVIQDKLNANFDCIDVEEYGPVTEKRKTWLRQDAKRKTVEEVALKIAEKITTRPPANSSLADFVSPDAPPESQQALIGGLRNAIEAAAHADPPAAARLFEKYRDTFLSLWQNDSPPVRNALAKTFHRLHALGVIGTDTLRTLDIYPTKLAGPFSENMRAIGQEMNDVRQLVALIEKDPLLSKAIYPVTLVFGSRLKGYGNRNADVDLAVIVRPETDPGMADKIRETIAQTAVYQQTHGEIVEFWLEKHGDDLRVRDEGIPGDYIGGSTWTHVLFGAAWEGEQTTINELRQQLLAPYLVDEGKKIDDRKALSVYLEELERDTLQYRLMHKGYENFNPAYGGVHGPHANEIDGESAFWDSGYRMTATKLFANRVFLPQIKK